jgi:ABC-2 type transport system ATP-binding protein
MSTASSPLAAPTGPLDSSSDREAVIRVLGLRKSYGDHQVIGGIELEVHHGEVFAFLGPNGAGKTTTVEILEGYRSRDDGEVSVLGADPSSGDRSWRSRLGLVLQTCTMPAELTVRELVELYAGYYPHPRPTAQTIDLVGLADKRDARTGQLSGGQLRRLDVALALIGDPELVFLDEPTTGFDPSARHHAWEIIANLRELGKTIFLTTHYMDEAQALADRVAIIVAGEIVAQGTPDTLGGRDRARSDISFALPAGAVFSELPRELQEIAQRRDGRVHIEAAEPARVLHTLAEWALAHDAGLGDLTVGRPTLEDIYLRLTDAQASPP